MSFGYEAFDYWGAMQVLEELPFLLKAAKTRRSIGHAQLAREIGIGTNTLHSMMKSPSGQLGTLVLVLKWLQANDPEMAHNIGPLRVNDRRAPAGSRRFVRTCSTCGQHFEGSGGEQVNHAARRHVEDRHRSMVEAFRNHLERGQT